LKTCDPVLQVRFPGSFLTVDDGKMSRWMACSAYERRATGPTTGTPITRREVRRCIPRAATPAVPVPRGTVKAGRAWAGSAARAGAAMIARRQTVIERPKALVHELDMVHLNFIKWRIIRQM
jgi:hypothetical protein